MSIKSGTKNRLSYFLFGLACIGIGQAQAMAIPPPGDNGHLPWPAPVEAVKPPANITDPSCTANPDLQACQDKVECRKNHKQLCASLLNTELERQVNLIPESPKKTIVPDKAGFKRRGQVVEGRATRGDSQDVYSKGGSSTLRLIQIPAALGRFRTNHGITLTAEQKAAIEERARWESEAGYESCNAYAYKIFPALNTVEDWQAENPTKPTQVGANILRDHLDQKDPFIPGQHELGKLDIGTAGPVNEEGYYPTPKDAPDQQFKTIPYAWHLYPFQSHWNDLNWTPGFPNGQTSYPFDADAHGKLLALVNSNTTTLLDLKSQMAMFESLKQANVSEEFLQETRSIEEHFQKLLNEQTKIRLVYEKEILEHNSIVLCGIGPPPTVPPGQEAAYCKRAQSEDADSMQNAITASRPLKDLMNELLIKANKLGCFTTAVQACSWSPTLMRNTLLWALYKFRTRREEVKRFCEKVVNERVTGGTAFFMEPQADYKWIIAKDNLPDPSTWKTDPKAFQSYYEKAVEYYKQVQLEKEKIIAEAQVTDPSTHKKQLGHLFSDTGYVGTTLLGKKIGGGYEYSTQWMTSDYSQNVCHADISNQLYFALTGDVLDIRVIDLKYNASLATDFGGAHSTATMTYNGANLIAPYDQSAGKLSFHFFANPSQKKDALSISQTIIVFCVPVTLSLGAYGEAGHMIDVTTEVQRTCDNTTVGDMRVKETGAMGPNARVALDASAAVDVGIADVGVRGDMTLVRLGLPLKINNLLGKRNPDQQEALQATLNLGLEVGTLDGSLSAFFDTIFGGAEATLVSWGGLSQTTTLQDESVNFSLKYARETLGSP